ncbi:ATP F0F1 synthase subunit B [Rhodobacteraceae bacterium NNCM2]|nr:ATP F0F1 synthase subunit B [Coraliihabitans acroporae]
MDIFYNSNFVVLLSFISFIALLGYLGVHKFLISKLDARAEGIREELDEARRLREEAQEVFASFERKQKEVEAQTSEIVAHAEAEAKAAAAKAQDEIAISVERRVKRAQEQIEMAETTAVKEVKDRAVQIAVAAAGEVLQKNLTAHKGNALINEAIDEVGKRLN